ncbi:MAG: polyamine ABC transporter ATP-binding protein [Candidatus Rokuibacteriota bacterium]|nr:MAG: polyamine ABC transporter ATP-binding protein [Candidatus Rokubacteria bacterium]
MGAAYLKLTGLVKSYDGRTNAVDGIDLDVARGEFVTLLGPSGSGKTTTLMMIAGFEEPTRGSIELDGEDLGRRKPYERNIGVVFQSYALFPHMTVAKNVAFPLRMRRFPAARQASRVREILDLVELGSFADKYPRELSGGQQQRVALARGLVFNPDVLLLDEPLGALDKSLREQMQVELKRIHREVGVTMLYVTHDQTEAMTMSDRIAVFNGGALEQVAPPLEVYHRPRTRFVGEFIGDSNFFSGRRDGERPGLVLLDGIGAHRVARAAWDEIAGSTVDVLIRPERIQLAGEGDEARLPNRVSMKVGVIVNYGDSVLVIGETDGHPLRMRIAGAQPDAIREGATVTVGWGPADAHLIRRD